MPDDLQKELARILAPARPPVWKRVGHWCAGQAAETGRQFAALEWGLLLRPGEWRARLRERNARGANDSVLGMNPMVVAVLALVVLSASLYSLKTPPPPPLPEQALIWSYDIKTRQMAVVPDTMVPPAPGLVAFVNPDNEVDPPPTLVRAHVFSCGACEQPETRFLGYLESTEPDSSLASAPAHEASVAPTPSNEASQAGSSVEQALAAAGSGYAVPAGRVRVYSAPGRELDWVPAESFAAGAVLAGPEKQCDGKGALKECRPAGKSERAFPRAQEEIENNPSGY